MEDTTTRRAWLDYRGAVLVALATGAFALVSGGHLASAHATKIFANHAMTVLPLLAGIFSVVAAVRSAGRTRTGWLLLGAWGLFSATGNAIWEYYEFVAHRAVPFPSLADVGYIAGNLCAVAAIAAFAINWKRVSSLRSVLDAVLIATSVFLVSWEVVLHSVYSQANGSTLLEKVVGLAYPLIDVIIVSMIVFVASQSSKANRLMLTIIGLGLLGWAFSDTSFALLTAKNTYLSGGPVDAGWIGGDALILLVAVAGAIHNRMPHDIGASTSIPRWRMHLPYIVGGCALAVSGITQTVEGYADKFELTVMLVLLLLVIVRQFLLVLENKATTIEHMRSVDEMKNGILRAVSHELRTPLTFIKGAALMLSDEDEVPKDVQQDLLRRLVRNADRLEDFLTGLLDLERLTRGVLEPARRHTDVTGLLQRIAASVNSQTHSIRVEGSEVWANIDSAQVERIVENLFVNATRHTPNGTSVQAHAEQTHDGVLITVSDNGPGVPDEIREHIFMPFAQAQESIDAGRGTGIGLALVAKFAQLHGGKAWVEHAPSGGAVFKVILGDSARAA